MSNLVIESFEPNEAGTKDKRYVRFFPYLSDVTRWIRDTKPIGDYRSSEEPNGYSNWYQTASLEEALDLYEKGWSISDEIDTLSSPIYTELSLQIEREDINYDVNGNYIDVARFADGEPECWGVFSPTIVDTTGKSRILKVVVCVTASAGVDSEVMKTKGILAATTVKLLEYAGYRCEVVAYDCRTNNRHAPSDTTRLETFKIFPVKKADQFLDESRMAFAMAHPSMLRRICFAIDERYNESDSTKMQFYRNCEGGCPGYGKVMPVPEPLRGDIYFDDSYLGFQWSDVDQAKAWVTNRLRQQGVRFKV